ncbi:hypothetical protein [Mesorhizobium sp. M0296]|uniref:hypothetical protein n=1 Tax=Mesorhizobium sp. M0296 TaxID=2956931 RepID=UPI00333DC5B5
MEYRYPKFSAARSIDMEINHPVHGWIPFTASPRDPEVLGRQLYASASASATPYVPATPPTVEELREAMPTLSPRQVRRALLSIGIAEADVEMKLVNDPAGMIEWRWATYFRRTHPLIDSLGSLFSITPAQIDSLWAWAAAL